MSPRTAQPQPPARAKMPLFARIPTGLHTILTQHARANDRSLAVETIHVLRAGIVALYGADALTDE